MKILLNLLSALLFATGDAKAAPMYQVQITDLMKRMTALEGEVSELNKKVMELEGRTKVATESGWTTCEIETPFDGNFSATEPTRTSALNKVVETCKAKAGNNSIYCDKGKVTCGK